MGALSDIKILDLSRILAGPFGTQILSDLGAEVWKVESPWGDDTRGWGPPFMGEESAYYLSANRGKKSIIVNLRDPKGQDIIKSLALKADVFVENFKVGNMKRFGLDYESLSKVNQGLIYASVTGFGQTGPRASEPGYDAALQGMTGVMSITGEPDGRPTKVGVAWIDILTGMTSTIGILAAPPATTSLPSIETVSNSRPSFKTRPLNPSSETNMLEPFPSRRIGISE